jgi:NAD(P)H dehydrogenase (quinone)
MKVAITAVGGNLGSAIINSLKSEIGPANIVGIACTPSKAEHLGMEIRKGDYNSREDLDRAFAGIDTVLLVSGMDAPISA